jgi:hypothetical protein
MSCYFTVSICSPPPPSIYFGAHMLVSFARKCCRLTLLCGCHEWVPWVVAIRLVLFFRRCTTSPHWWGRFFFFDDADSAAGDLKKDAVLTNFLDLHCASIFAFGRAEPKIHATEGLVWRFFGSVLHDCFYYSPISIVGFWSLIAFWNLLPNLIPKGNCVGAQKTFPTTLTHRVPRTRSTTRHASTSLNMRISQLWAFGPDCFLESLAELLYGFHQKLSFPLLLVIREPFLWKKKMLLPSSLVVLCCA